MITKRLARTTVLSSMLILEIASVGLFPIQPAYGQANLIKNGDFSQGLSFWTTTTVTQVILPRPERNTYPIFEIHNNDVLIQPGNPALSIDAPLGADGYVEQAITIPSSSGVLLSFRTWGHQDPVTATISIIDAQNLEHVIDQFNPACHDVLGCRTPETKSYDITALAGQNIKLRFRNTSALGEGTFADFDDVEIIPNSLPSTFKSQWISSNVWSYQNPAIGLTMNPASNFLTSVPFVASTSSFAYLFQTCGKLPSSNALLKQGEKEAMCVDAALRTTAAVAGDVEFILDIPTRPIELVTIGLERTACKQGGVLVAALVEGKWKDIPVSGIALVSTGTTVACRLAFKVAHNVLQLTPIAIKTASEPSPPAPAPTLPEFGSCTLAQQPEDPISMNTVRSGNIAKTIHAEKEIFGCQLEQGNIPVTVDVTIIAEIYENMNTQSITSKQAHVITCMKTSHTLIGCIAEVPLTDVAPVRNCTEEPIGHPQGMNTVNKGKIAKTIEAQKEVFRCDFGNTDASDDKKVDLVLFTEIWEDLGRLPGNTVVKKAFESFRCVTSIDTAKVESCQFQS